MDILSFPKLGIDLTINKVAFTILGLPIYWYSIIIASGVLLAIFYTQKRSKKFGIDPDGFFDVAIGGIIAGIIGARLFYIIFAWDEFSGNILEVFAIRSGGLAIYGGIIVGPIVGYFLCKWRKVEPLPALDLAGLGFLIGQGVGRWGNFVNMEAFGTNTNLPWGMTSETIQRYLVSTQPRLEAMGMSIDPTMPVHPTFLYESLWCAIVFALLHFYSKKRKFDGEILLLYVAMYGLGRFFIEGMRTDSLYIGNMRVSRLLSAILFLVAIGIWIVITGRIKRENDSEFMKLFVLTDGSKNHLKEIEEGKKIKKNKKEILETIVEVEDTIPILGDEDISKLKSQDVTKKSEIVEIDIDSEIDEDADSENGLEGD